jgi:hydroxymethylbilane synthase
MSSEKTILIATRGSALALAQANFILGECRRLFPERSFDLKIIKTTGDKLQKASMARIDATLPRGLFTKELEEALLNGHADLAVHSLKDLPTSLPDGLKLGASPEREDIRDVLISRAETGASGIAGLRHGAIVATSSTRRKAQLLELRPDLNVVEIRGNVGTRLQKLADQRELDALILAAAGLKRLHFNIAPDGQLSGEAVPAGLIAAFLSADEMLPCVGQAALGIEIRENDSRLDAVCERLNHLETWQCITAERSFLRAMGGGCQSPVAAHGQIVGNKLQLKAVSFFGKTAQHAQAESSPTDAEKLGQQIAAQLR